MFLDSFYRFAEIFIPVILVLILIYFIFLRGKDNMHNEEEEPLNDDDHGDYNY